MRVQICLSKKVFGHFLSGFFHQNPPKMIQNPFFDQIFEKKVLNFISGFENWFTFLFEFFHHIVNLVEIFPIGCEPFQIWIDRKYLFNDMSYNKQAFSYIENSSPFSVFSHFVHVHWDQFDCLNMICNQATAWKICLSI